MERFFFYFIFYFSNLKFQPSYLVLMFWACGKAEFNSKSTWYNKAAYVLVSKKEEVRERSQARK